MSTKVVMVLKPLPASDLEVSRGVSSLVHSEENNRRWGWVEQTLPTLRRHSSPWRGGAVISLWEMLRCWYTRD